MAVGGVQRSREGSGDSFHDGTCCSVIVMVTLCDGVGLLWPSSIRQIPENIEAIIIKGSVYVKVRCEQQMMHRCRHMVAMVPPLPRCLDRI